MTFDVEANSYDRFMGRYSAPLAARFADDLCRAHPHTALDVGCGPGALTAELVDRLGAASVAAVDPSEPFVAAAQQRFPGADIRLGSAESLPFPSDSFDLVAAQLVVHFMTDPVGGLQEMARVTRPGGVVAANVWDFAGERAPISVFWRAVARLDPGSHDESGLPGARAGGLGRLFVEAGIGAVKESELAISVPFGSFYEWWDPFTLGVGPAGAYVAKLTEEDKAVLRAEIASVLPTGPFEIDAIAWVATGRA